MSGHQRFFTCCGKAVRIWGAVFASFEKHQGGLRVSALTYTTVLALVPFLAIVLSVLKGLGVQNNLEPLLLKLMGDSSSEHVTRIIGYVNHTNAGSLGAIGIIMLVVTMLALMSTIEEAFNITWGVRETRPFRRRFSDYLSVVIFGPLLMVVAVSMTSAMESRAMVKWLITSAGLGGAVHFIFRFLPYLSVWGALTFLYIYIPNVKVNFRSALLGGIIAGTLWQLAQWGYFHFQVGVGAYNAASPYPLFISAYTMPLRIPFHTGHLLCSSFLHKGCHG